MARGERSEVAAHAAPARTRSQHQHLGAGGSYLLGLQSWQRLGGWLRLLLRAGEERLKSLIHIPGRDLSM